MILAQELEPLYGAGLDTGAFDNARQLAAKGCARLKEQQGLGELPVLSLPERLDDLTEIEKVAAYIRSNFTRLVVFGTGGSSLGGQTLVALKQSAFGLAPQVKVDFIDNTDPYSMDTLLKAVNLAQTCFLVVSKSGTTAETLVQFFILLEAVRSGLGAQAIAKHFIAITVPEPSPLRQAAEQHGIRVLEHDPKVGGRFSVLSNVALIPAAVAGVDIRALRRGAGEALRPVMESQACATSQAVEGAAAHWLLMRKGISVSVLMPYCDRLSLFGAWYMQLWAESLGKEGQGTTAMRALGAVDQHSQLQLYLGGPRDKFLTLILLKNSGKGPCIRAEYAQDESLSYLRGKQIGDVLDAQQRATAETLIKHGLPVRILRIAELNEESMGALLMHFMLETMLTAHLMGLNAFDQPAVEESKILARRYLLEGGKEAA